MENGDKSARARVLLDLPEVADGSGDGTWVIRIGHTRDRHPEGLTLGRGRVGVAGRRVEDRQHAHWFGIFAGHQDDRLVGELQPLDVGETVDAVGADGVGDGDDIVRRVAHCAVGIDVDRIVGPRPGEVDGVEVVIGAGIARQDLTNNPELAGVVGAVDHQRDHVGHAVEGGDLVAGAIKILKDADAHIEPLVAVDQVIAAAALQDVAAFAAEHDVAGAERGHTCADELLQAADELEIGEHAAGEARDGDRSRVGIIALQDVGLFRSGQPFHAFEPGIDRCGRPRLRRFIERADVEIDGDAERIVLEHRPVEAGLAEIAVTLAAAVIADQDVVAALTIHAVGDAVADEDVVTNDLVAREGIGVVAGPTIGGAKLDPVVAFAACAFFVGAIAQNKVIAGAAEPLADVLIVDDEVVAEAADQQVYTLATVEYVVAVLRPA